MGAPLEARDPDQVVAVAAALELENARKEAQILRKSLIDAKREISRLSNGVDSSRLRARTSSDDIRPGERDSMIRKR